MTGGSHGFGESFVMVNGMLHRTAAGSFLLAMAACLCVCPAFAAGIFRVNAASAADTPDGSSWDRAYKTLQDGADAAEAAGGGEVWVAEGRYTAVATAVLAMKATVGLYGGFCTSETEFSTRDWTANPTVIDGENARRCVLGANDAVLDGFTVTQGVAVGDGSDLASTMGGGMMNKGVSPVVRNCLFVKNSASLAGGAACNFSAASQFADCTFRENTVANPYQIDYFGGGAVLNWQGAPSFARCMFKSNTVITYGGAMNNYQSNSTVENCIFAQNSSGSDGGAMFNCLYSTVSVMNCNFSGNHAGNEGGAIRDYQACTRVKNSILWGDDAKYGYPELLGGCESSMVTYSCVQGGDPGAGNTDTNPLLVGDDAGTLQLAPGSPCLDAGTADGAPSTDLLGRPRPAGNGVDMGAYEGTADPKDLVTLSVRVSPESAGRTTPPAGSHYYMRGATATLSMKPIGYGFAGWSGGVVSDEPEITVLMDSDKTVTAEFAPHVIHVNAAQANPGDGTSWKTAFKSLQAAVDAAAVLGGEVWVAKGAYTAAATPVLAMRPGVFLFGGFAGTETAREQRDWTANVTTIDGEDTRRCVEGADDAMLDGFTITRGFALNSYGSLDYGGGMYNNRVSPTVAHCVFSKNVSQGGGGIYNSYAAPTIRDCSFSGNMAAMYTYSSPYSQYGNTYYKGGAVNNRYGSATFLRCVFEDNVAAMGAGICNDYCNSTITGCLFKYNTTHDPSSSSNAITGGAAVSNLMAGTSLQDCVFIGNEDRTYDSFSGGGAILNVSDSYSPPLLSTPIVTVCNSLFRDNFAQYNGGAIYNLSLLLVLDNCSFVNNHHSYGEGDTIYNRALFTPADGIPPPTMTNCIVRGGRDSGVQQITDSYDPSSSHSLKVTYSCVEGGYAGTGNIDVDPLFSNAEIGDLRLSPGSPCIDTGTANGAPRTDILGIPRPQGAGVDMGAYEYDATPPNAPVVSGPGSLTNNPRPEFTWGSGGNGGAGLYRYGFAEGFWLATDLSATTFTPSSDVSDGRYVFYVQERDVAGNWSASGTCTVTVDTAAPNAPTVNGPLSPSSNPRPTWTWSGGGGGAHLFRFGYSEDAWIAVDVTATTFTPEENLSDGSHKLHVQERDVAGNWSALGSFAVTVDTTPPNTPVVGGAVSSPNSAKPTWTWISGGNGGIGQFRFGHAEGAWLAVDAPAVSFTPDADLADGSHALYVQERDAAGNWSTSGSATVTVNTVVHHTVTVQPASGGGITLDPPQPEAGGYAHGTTITVTATANTGHGFINWTGDLSGTANPAPLVVDGDKMVGAVFAAFATEGEPPAEGELQPPTTAEEAAQRLSDAFAGADTDGSGTLTEAEAMAAVAGMTQDQFAQLDANGDGQITRDELDAASNVRAGCACRKAAASGSGLKQRLVDLFLMGLTVTTLLTFRTKRP
jgi:hypothetical protein